ncbi:MAG: methyltransferase domain-containing protein [Bdellovibrio sp.]|nr:MAG: methyltransferase domain-containing protein [Bdellovibrio sp.]
METVLHNSIREYYGQVLKTKEDLKTSACCTGESLPLHLSALLKNIHPTVKEKFYGCGTPFPDLLEGLTVLDLGSGSGRDCYLFSQLVGPSGKVIGVDMTEEQIQVAKQFEKYHQEKFQYEKSNVFFYQSYIEDLHKVVPDQSVDLVVSNCVLNLSPYKDKVFSEIFRVLKPGGELYFSDVFADRRIPQHLMKDPILLGECLSGALYIEDFRRMLSELQIKDFRIVKKSSITLHDPEIIQKIGMVQFHSITIRAFKLPLEDKCEDYGQIAIYKGTIPHHPHGWALDDHHYFEAHKPLPVCGNTADMLSQTRFKNHFEIMGSKEIHFGLFKDCGPSQENTSPEPAGCC